MAKVNNNMNELSRHCLRELFTGFTPREDTQPANIQNYKKRNMRRANYSLMLDELSPKTVKNNKTFGKSLSPNPHATTGFGRRKNTQAF